MRKIIQVLYDHTAKTARPLWLVLCDDGSVWRQVMVEDPVQRKTSGILLIQDPTFHTEWEHVQEFDLIPEPKPEIETDPEKLRKHAEWLRQMNKEWTPDDENERGR